MAVAQVRAREARQQVVDEGPRVIAQLDDLEPALDAGVSERARGRRGESIGEQPRRRGLAQPRGDDHQPSLCHATLTGTVSASGTSAVGAAERSEGAAGGRGVGGRGVASGLEAVVRGRLGHVRGLEGGELPAQHGHHERAQHLELLEGHARRQAGMVDQEQLPLVVADDLAEAHRAVDDLLRAADRQRGLGHVVLERRPAAVHRRVVEVRPVLPDRGLRVGAHEHLPAEPDDRLVGRPVPVVLEPSPVEVDHPPHVIGRPEDVVVEEAVAVVGGLLRDLGAADRAVPHERRDAVERARDAGEAGQRRPEPALPVDDVLAPQAVEQRVVLDRERDAVADVLAEPRVDRAGVPAAHHQVHATAREMLEVGVVLRDLHRVVGGDQRRGGRQDDPARLRRHVAHERGRGRGDERRVVMLAGREHVEPELLRGQGERHHLLDPLVLADRVTGERVDGHVADAEDSELHAGIVPD